MIESTSQLFLELDEHERDLDEDIASSAQADFQAREVATHVGSVPTWTFLLDDFCASEQDVGKRKPLFFMGAPGSGKTHGIVKWMEQRRMRNEAAACSEVLLYYNAKVSRQSHSLEAFLNFCIKGVCTSLDESRLNHGSEQYTERDLCSLLDKALTLAEDVGAVIVLDGFERLRRENGTHAGFDWVPVELPPTVRLIVVCRIPAAVVATVHDNNSAGTSYEMKPLSPADEESEETGRRRIAAAKRVGCVIAEVPTKTHPCEALIRAFLEKGDDLRLFENQIDLLAAHPCCMENLSFLFAVLRILRCFAQLCLDVSSLLEKCMQVESLKPLYEFCFEALEKGGHPTNEGAFNAWRTAKSSSAILFPVGNGIPELPSDSELKERERIELRVQAGAARSHSNSYSGGTVDLTGMAHVPIYLLGGRDVPGVYGLKFALGLARSSRYGLTFDEVTALVKQLQSSELQKDIPPSNMASLYLLFHTLDLANQTDMVFVSPRFSALCKFIDSCILQDEDWTPRLQNMVQKVYVNDDSSVMETDRPSKAWRKVLALYYQSLPAYTRKLQELPWLYQVNHQWKELKAFVTDIPTFKKLWRGSSDLRKDLTRYWRVLGTHSVDLIDTKLGNCADASTPPAANYDIVEEYTHAVDIWKSGKGKQEVKGCSATPSEEDVSRVISAITMLLLRFGRFESDKVPYLHSPVVDNSITSLGVVLPHATEEWIKESVEALGQSNLSLSSTAASLLHFDRLIQANLSRLTANPARSHGSDQMERRQGIHSDTIRTARKFIAEQARLCSYRRWVWIHFPELACVHVNTAKVSKRKQQKSRAKSFFDLKVVTPSKSGMGPSRPPSMRKVFEIVPRVEERRTSNLTRALDDLEMPSEESTTSRARDGIPFSSPSVRSQRTGTRFPTFDAVQKQNLDLSHLLAADRKANAYLNELTNREVGSNDEVGNKGRTETTKIVDVVDKLREELNRMLYISASLNDELDSLHQLSKEQGQQERRQQQVLQKGSSLIAELEKKQELMTRDLAAESERQYKYERICNACETFPAKDDKHLGLLEGVLARIQQEVKILEIQKDQLESHNRRVATDEISKLEGAIIERGKMYANMLRKLKGHREVQQERIKEKLRRFQKRAELAERIRKADVKLTQQRLIKLSTQQKHYKDELDAQVQSQKDMLAYYKKASQRIISKTRVSSLSVFASKFTEMKHTKEELEAKIRQLEASIEDRKLTHHTWTTELRALQIGGDDEQFAMLEQLKDRISTAEARGEQARKAAEESLQTVKLCCEKLTDLKTLLDLPKRLMPTENTADNTGQINCFEEYSSLVCELLSNATFS